MNANYWFVVPRNTVHTAFVTTEQHAARK